MTGRYPNDPALKHALDSRYGKGRWEIHKTEIFYQTACGLWSATYHALQFPTGSYLVVREEARS